MSLHALQLFANCRVCICGEESQLSSDFAEHM